MKKAMKKFAAAVIAMVAVVAVVGTSVPAEAAAAAPRRLTLKATSSTVDIKGKTTVSVKSVTPATASKAVTYKSSNTKVATVSSKGVVTGKKAGKVTITATSKSNKKAKATIKITVKDLKPTKISAGKLSMVIGEKKAVKTTVRPAGVYCPVSYSSSNKKVATVSSTGVVTGKGYGKATITVKARQKNSKGKYIYTKCTVTVTEKMVFANKEKTVKSGVTYTNKLTITPKDRKVTYTSSAPEVATVDASGKVTTLKAGVATITAKLRSGSKKSASYKLTVTDRVNDAIDWQYMTSDEVFESIANGENLIIIDLRPNVITREGDTEVPDAGYAAGHIAGSIHVPAWPVGDKTKEDMLRTTYLMEQLKDNDSPIAFICQSGQGGAKRAISVLNDEGIDASRLYIQQGGGIDLIKNHADQLVKGDEEFAGSYVISAADVKAKIDANEKITLVDTRGVKDTAETAKNAITMVWQEISASPMTDGTVFGQAGFARTLSAEEVSKKLSAIGLGLDDEIILFSDGYVNGGWGDDGRVAWQLTQCGYKNVKIVNGGLPAMKAAGIATQTGASARVAKDVKVEKVDTETHDFTTEALLERVKAGTVKVVDVRANAEYDGATLYGETSGGHVKGAIHIRFTDLFKYDGSLKSVAELTKMFEDAGLKKTDTIATYCTGGIRSAYMQLVLEMCGFEDSHNYAESAYRWSNTEDAKTTDYWDKVTPVRSLKFAKDSVELKVKDASKAVKLTVKPANATDKSVTYTSSDEKIAVVDETGKVTAKGYGTATITATSVSNPDVTATLNVTVTKPEAVETRQVFVSPEWAKSAQDGDQEGYDKDNVFVSEVSWGASVSFKKYSNGIIPGSYHINSDAVEYDDCDPWPMGDGIDDFELYDEKEVHPLDNFNIRSPKQLSVFLKRNNITKDTKVILYGKSAGASEVTRVAFAMIYAGVEDVKVINGGMPAWVKANLPTTKEVAVQTEGGDDYNFGTTIPAHPEYLMDIDTVREKLESDANFRLVSIRSTEEFVGKTSGYGYIDDSHAGEPQGAVWGHDSGDYVTEDGKVVDIDVLSKYLSESGSSLDNEVSFYCGTGWRATIPFFIAYEKGYDNVSLYDGGWWLWQLKHYGWEEKGIPAEPDKYPIQQITPEAASKAINYISVDDVMADLAGERTYKVLDVRKAADYATAHVVGSVSADVDGAKTGEDVATATANIKAAIEGDAENTKYVVVCYSGNSYAKAATTILRKAGVENTNIFTLEGGMKSWNEKYANYNVKSYTSTKGFEFKHGITVDQLKADVDAEKQVFTVVDLRSATEYAAGHIEGAVSSSLRNKKEDGTLEDLDDATCKANLKAIVDANPKGLYVLECYSGNNYANKAIGYLTELGVSGEQMIVLEGGAGAWTTAGYPVVTE